MIVALLISDSHRRHVMAAKFRRAGIAIAEFANTYELRACVEAGVFPTLVFIHLAEPEKTGEFSLEVKFNLEGIPVWCGGFSGFTNIPSSHGPLPDRYFGTYSSDDVLHAFLDEQDSVRFLSISGSA